MRLIYITYKLDAHDSLVGHAVGWINELAHYMESIEVICLAAGKGELADNVRVHSLGKEHGTYRIVIWLRFFRTVWRLRDCADAVFCQFSPEYVIAIAAIAKLRGWPIVLWYTHRHVSWKLRLATTAAARIVTASLDSFRIVTPKVRVIGHGIDTRRFRPSVDARTDLPVILAVGRLSPIKNYELLIDATAIIVKQYGHNYIQCRIVGRVEGKSPPKYTEQLQNRIDRAGLRGVITLVGAVPHDQIVREYQHATVNINLCPTGGMDKAVLEGMAVEIPTLVRNAAFAPLMETFADLLVIRDHQVHSVASQILAVVNLSQRNRQHLGQTLRQTVEKGYGQENFIARLAAVVRESAG